jgi:broad specificity phosphatase PhoE
VERGVASKLWKLDERAREDCVLLAHALPADIAPVAYSSGQPKADETAAVIALRRRLRSAIDARFAEVDQDAAGWIDDYRAAAPEYLATGASPGWEAREAVVQRFEAAVADALGDASTGDLVVATHGLALSLWLASRTGIDIVPFWQELTFPDAWRLDIGSGQLTHVFSAGAPPPDR